MTSPQRAQERPPPPITAELAARIQLGSLLPDSTPLQIRIDALPRCAREVDLINDILTEAGTRRPRLPA